MSCERLSVVGALGMVTIAAVVAATVMAGCGEPSTSSPVDSADGGTPGTSDRANPVHTDDTGNLAATTVVLPSSTSVDDTGPSTIASPSTTADEPTIAELLDTPIDQFPSHMYSTSECKQLLTRPPAPDPATDYAGEPLELDEIVEKASVITRGRVADADTPVVFTPDGAPDEFFEAVGADTPSDLSWPYTPVQVELTEVVQGPFAAEDHVVVVFAGCWAKGAVALTTPGAEVLLLGDVSDPNNGVTGLIDSDIYLFDWLHVNTDGRLIAGDNIFGVPSDFEALSDEPIDEALAELRALSQARSD